MFCIRYTSKNNIHIFVSETHLSGLSSSSRIVLTLSTGHKMVFKFSEAALQGSSQNKLGFAAVTDNPHSG